MFRSKSSFANLVVAALYCLTGLEIVRANSENEEVVTPGSDPKCITTMSLPSDGSNAATTGQIVVYYDPDTELMNMNATIALGTYAAWGWGGTME